MPADRPIGYRRFQDGTRRPIFLDQDGRQYVINDGRPVHGVWLEPRRSDQANDTIPILGDAQQSSGSRPYCPVRELSLDNTLLFQGDESSHGAHLGD